MLSALAAAILTIPATFLPPANFGGVDDEGAQTIEAEILKTLFENGAISEAQYKELLAKAAKMRKERVDTHSELESAIAKMNEALDARVNSQEKKEEATASISFKNGFFLKSSDGNYSLHPWIVLRERFTFVDVGNVSGLANEDIGSFETRTARIWLDGHAVTPDLTYLIMFDLAGATSLLRDGWIDYKFDNAFHVRVGQQKRPIDYEGFSYAPQTGLVDKAPSVVFFQRNPGEDFEAGATVWGRLGNDTFEYRVGVFNGDGPQNGSVPGLSLGPGGGPLLPGGTSNNDSSGLESVARVMWMPMGPMSTHYFTNGYGEGDYGKSKDPKFLMGGHYSFNPERNNGATPGVKVKQKIQTAGVDAVFAYEGLFAIAEVFVRTTDRVTAAGIPDTTDNGYFGQLQYFFGSETPNRGFEVIGRWSVIDVDAATLGLVPVASATEVHDATVGLNYLFNGHRLKLQSALTHRRRILRASEDAEDMIFQMQLQVIL
ncbi:MAG: porin [Planctomycetota bacterium]